MRLYKNGLWHFCDFLKMTTEEIASKYCNGGFTEEESPSSINNNKESTFKLQQKVEDYILLTQTRALNNNLKTATIHAATRPIMLFSEMNVIYWSSLATTHPATFFFPPPPPHCHFWISIFPVSSNSALKTPNMQSLT
jgi:hypothetical protein